MEILDDMTEQDRRELLHAFSILSDPLTRKILAYLAADPK